MLESQWIWIDHTGQSPSTWLGKTWQSHRWPYLKRWFMIFSKNHPSMMTKPFVWVPSAEFMRQEFFCAHLQEPAAWLEEGVSEFCWNWDFFFLTWWHWYLVKTPKNFYTRSFQHAQAPTLPSNETIHFLASFCIDTRPAQAFFEATRKVLWLGGILQVIMVAFFGAAATWPGRWDCIFGMCFWTIGSHNIWCFMICAHLDHTTSTRYYLRVCILLVFEKGSICNLSIFIQHFAWCNGIFITKLTQFRD